MRSRRPRSPWLTLASWRKPRASQLHPSPLAVRTPIVEPQAIPCPIPSKSNPCSLASRASTTCSIAPCPWGSTSAGASACCEPRARCAGAPCSMCVAAPAMSRSCSREQGPRSSASTSQRRCCRTPSRRPSATARQPCSCAATPCACPLPTKAAMSPRSPSASAMCPIDWVPCANSRASFAPVAASSCSSSACRRAPCWDGSIAFTSRASCLRSDAWCPRIRMRTSTCRAPCSRGRHPSSSPPRCAQPDSKASNGTC